MARLRIICFLLFVYVFYIEASISDKRLCADPNCSRVISHAKVMLRYISSDHRMLSLRLGDTVKIYSKSAGSRGDLWGVEVNGKRGYAPSGFLRELKVFIPTRDLKHIVPTEEEAIKAPAFVGGASADSVPKESLSRDGASAPIEVIDGTTLFLNPDGEAAESKPIQATAVNVNAQPSAVPQQPTGTTENSQVEQPKPLDASEQEGSTIEPSNVPSPLHEVESATTSFLNSVTSYFSGDSSGVTEGNDEEEEEDEAGSGDEGEEDEEGEGDDYEDDEEEEEDEDIPEKPDGIESESGMLDNTDDGDAKPSVNGEPSLPTTHNNTVLMDVQDDISNTTADDSDPLPQIETEKEARVPLLDIKTSPPPPLVLQRLPIIANILSDADKSEEVEDKSGNVNGESSVVKEEVLVDASIPSQDVKEGDQSQEGVINVEQHLPVSQMMAENMTDGELSPESIPKEQQAEFMSEPLNQTKPAEAIQADLPNLEDVKESERLEENAKSIQNDEQLISKGIESNVLELGNEEIFQANTTQNDDQQLVKETEEVSTNLEANKIEEQDLEGKPEGFLSETQNEVADIQRDPKEEALKIEEVSASPDRDNIEKQELKGKSGLHIETGNLFEDTLGSSEETASEIEDDAVENEDDSEKANVQEESPSSGNLDANGGQLTDQKPEDPTILFNEFVEPLQYVSTESGSESLEGSPYIEDIVTEAYTMPQESDVIQSENDIKESETVDQSTENVSAEEKESTLKNAIEEEPSMKQDQEEAVTSEESQGFMTGILESLIAYFSAPKQQNDDGSSEEPVPVENLDGHEGHRDGDHLISTFYQEAAAVCDSECEARKLGSDPVVDQSLPTSKEISSHDVLITMEDQRDFPLYSLSFFVVTAITVLLFTLGYYYLEKKQRDGVLLSKINKLEKALLASAKEKTNLQVNLEEMTEKLTSFSTSSCPSDRVVYLEAELEEAKAMRLDLEEQVATLERELDTATETGLELNRMMSEFLSAQQGSDSLMKSVEHLQKQLDNQQGTINTMNTSLSAKSLENESLQADLNLAEERIKGLEEEVEKLKETLINEKKEKQDMEHEFQQKSKSIESQLIEALEGKSDETQRLSRELETLQEVLDETRRTLASRDGELEVLRDCLRKADDSGGGDTNTKLLELADVGKARAELSLITKERDGLQERLQGEEEARKLLEDHVRIVSEEVDSLRTKYREAEHAKVEAQTRLEVLSTYFKEKETQLQKELGLQEAMYIQKEGDAMSTIERIKSLQEEVESYKSQNETLKKEILDQERGLKAQIATLEKKAHENWVVARQAERRLEETKQENGQLRNRLTLVERNFHNTSDTPKLNERHPIESNGEHPTSPLPMVGLGDLQDLPGSPLHYGHPASPPLQPLQSLPAMPPPVPFPPMFLPPPPHGLPFMPPLPPGDRRPPPLGRMSSPPPSPYDRSPPHSPPHGRPHYRSPPPRSPPPRYDDSPERERDRYHSRRTPPYPPYPGPWDDHGPPHPRSGFRPLRRESPRELKGSNLSSGHSSESIDKSSRHSGRV